MSDRSPPPVADPDTVVLPLVEERLLVGKRVVETGRVRVRTIVDTHDEIARADLMHSDVEIERVPVDREVAAVPEVRQVGDTIIIPVVEEVLETRKILVLSEEIHLHRRTRRTPFVEKVTLRRQRATIERLPGRNPADPDSKT